tara:strand:- start:655 stop:1395 length:741 start_codon:yes stop_codon:yes gene_type:complete
MEEEYEIPDDTPGFRRVNAVFPAHIYPSQLSDIERGYAEFMESYVLKFVPSLQGAVVSFKDVEASSELGRIMNDQPEIHVDLKASFLVFSPKPGEELTGIVSNIGYDHVGVVICEKFNATITAEDILSTGLYVHDENQNCFISAEGNDTEPIEVGSELGFYVLEAKPLNHAPGLQVRGSLAPPRTIETTPLLSSSSKKSSKSKKLSLPELDIKESKSPKKSKKSKRGSEEDGEKKRKKKKSRKSEE